MLEMRNPQSTADPAWTEREDDVRTARILSAVETLDRDRAARDRARSNGMGRVVVLLLGVGLVVTVVVTLSQLVTEAFQGLALGM